MRGRLDATPTGLWGIMRERYAPEVRETVDRALELGQVTLADLVPLELAELLRLQRLLDTALEDQAEGGKVGHKTIAALASVQLQVRKNLRSMVSTSTGGVDPHHALVPLPPELTLEALRAYEFEADDIL
jgi:hypothetical protein